MTQQRICSICGKASYEGLSVGDRFICADCEMRMLSVEPGSDEYEKMLDGLRDIALPDPVNTQAQADALEAELDAHEEISVDALLERSGLIEMKKDRYDAEFAMELTQFGVLCSDDIQPPETGSGEK